MFALGEMVLEAKREAWAAQRLRYEAHCDARPSHPNEATLKAIAETPGPHDDNYWAERTTLFRPVYAAICEWDRLFWKSETYLENPDDPDEE